MTQETRAMTTRRSPFLFALALFAASCSGVPDTPPPAPIAAVKAAPGADVLEPYQCGDVQRIHAFQGMFLASQPTPVDFEHAQENGIKTVVDLRHRAEHKDFDEAAHVTKLGITYVNLPWNGPDELTDAVLDQGRELLARGERPMMVHCSSGNRIGPLWIAWRVLDGKVSFEQAHGEAVQIGMKTPAYAEKAKAYVERRMKG
jgi:uncharacterized protein (TIGR01244 family)